MGFRQGFLLFSANFEVGSPWLNCLPRNGPLVSLFLKVSGRPRLPLLSCPASIYQNMQYGRAVYHSLFIFTRKRRADGLGTSVFGVTQVLNSHPISAQY